MIKHCVRLNDLSPQIVLAYIIACGVYNDFHAQCVITSVNDGEHSPASLHNIGHAMDLRTSVLFEDERPKVADDLRERLGPEFDVVLESDHIHVEYQPKR